MLDFFAEHWRIIVSMWANFAFIALGLWHWARTLDPLEGWEDVDRIFLALAVVLPPLSIWCSLHAIVPHLRRRWRGTDALGWLRRDEFGIVLPPRVVCGAAALLGAVAFVQLTAGAPG
jgi:hypothetical protein